MQANRKRFEPGCDHPDRDQQFTFIAEQAQAFQSAGNPMISIDGKKKELIGNYKNNGKEYHPVKQPVDVNGHDFPDPKVPKVFWLTLFVYGLAKPVVISSSLIPGFHWWSGNSPYGILSIR